MGAGFLPITSRTDYHTVGLASERVWEGGDSPVPGEGERRKALHPAPVSTGWSFTPCM